MRITDFDVYKDLLKEKSGLVITADKSYLLDSRLSPIAKKWGYPTLDAMTVALQGVADRDLVNDVVEAMTTNETSFFRDTKPFEVFKGHVLPYIKEARGAARQLKLWCAASSSGQEPYSIAMTLRADPELKSWKTDMLATDISHDILAQAKEGIYSQFEVQRGLPVQMLMDNFTQTEEKWQIKDEVRNMIRFEYFNLLDSMTGLGKFDIIFCRNVLIYFDEETKTSVFEKMAGQLEKDGFLFLGGAETVLGITDLFKPVPGQRGLYAMEGSPHLEARDKDSGQALA